MSTSNVSTQTRHPTRVVLICGPPAVRQQAVKEMESTGRKVTRLADADAVLDILANGREEADVAVVELFLPGLCLADLIRWCREAEIEPPEMILAPDDEQTNGTSGDVTRCLHISGPVDAAAEEALRACPTAKAHRECDWQTRMAKLEREAEERTKNLEAARAQAEKNYHDLQTAQSQLLQSEKLASIGQLAAGVAHEINNPIGFIYSNMNTLCDYIADVKEFAERSSKAHQALLANETDRASELVRDLDKWSAEVELDYMFEDLQSLVAETIDGAERVKKIVMDLRTFSRAEENHKTTSDINKGLESTMNLCWNELKYHCEVIKELGDIPDLICYPMKLNQVFMNLIVNAAHAVEGKGTVAVRTWHDNSNIFVQVSDTGCGIPKENLDKIFDPFFTTKPVGKGTGLGLSIAASIIAEHDGEISIESEVGKGTTFTVRLPMTGRKMPEYNLLLVDDEPNILNALRRLLRREGYKLHMTSSGDEALEILAEEHVDIVLADGRMPGMSGTELLKKVKAQYPDTVRMVLTGYTDVGELVSAINEGEAYRFILKPWNDEELKLTIRHALEHHKLAKENEQLIARIKEQNEQLKLLNTGLEAAVERKTHELQIHNRVLLLGQEVLDQLPIAVVGVDDTGTIVQANSRGLESALLKGGAIGSNIKNCVPEHIQKTVRDTIESGTSQALEHAEALGEANMFCYPLKRRGGTRGAVLISYPLDNPVFEHLHIMLSDDKEMIAE